MKEAEDPDPARRDDGPEKTLIIRRPAASRVHGGGDPHGKERGVRVDPEFIAPGEEMGVEIDQARQNQTPLGVYRPFGVNRFSRAGTHNPVRP